MSRVKLTTYRGHRILRWDWAGLTPDEFIAEYEKAVRLIAREPASSVRLLTIPTNQFDERLADVIRRLAPEKAKYVLAEALVGATGIHKMLFLANKAKYRLNREVFDEEEAAKDWLISR